jgi:hypothetical protein
MAAPYNPPVKNEDIVVYVGLPDMAVQGSFRANPTIAAGDFQVVQDDGSAANLATLPTVVPAGSVRVKIVVSASEMNGNNVTIIGIDQEATKEWADFMLNIPTTA